jgi:exosortase
MTIPAVAPRLRLAALPPLVLALAALVWAFWTTLLDLAQTWSTNPQYSHGFLVPVFAAFLLWHRRDLLDASRLRPSWWGLLLIAGGLSLRLFATYKYFISLDAIALVPCLAGVVFLLGGWGAWRWAWPSVLFLVFMIPLPYSLATALSGPLQRLATITSTFVMQTFGMPALAEGNVILLEEHQIGVVEACSGLRMLVVFFALAAAVVLVISRPLLDRAVIIASAIPIAIVSNIIRITTTGIMYEMGYGEWANHFFHDIAGWLMMPLALMMLGIELKILGWLIIEAPAGVPRTSTAGRRNNSPVPRPAVPRSRRPAPREAKEPRHATTPVSSTVPNREIQL